MTQLTPSFSSTYPVLTLYRRDATNPWHLLLTFPTPTQARDTHTLLT